MTFLFYNIFVLNIRKVEQTIKETFGRDLNILIYLLRILLVLLLLDLLERDTLCETIYVSHSRHLLLTLHRFLFPPFCSPIQSIGRKVLGYSVYSSFKLLL